MKDILIDYDRLREMGRTLNRISDDYYQCTSKMGVIIDLLDKNASVFYEEGYEIYRNMLRISSYLDSLGGAAITAARRYEDVETFLEYEADNLETALFGTAATVSGGPLVFGNVLDIIGENQGVNIYEISPSSVISDYFLHESWLMELYADKIIKKEVK